MPKQADYQIQWSNAQGYEIVHGPFRFSLSAHFPLQHWLDRSTTFHVCCSRGESFTLRKETKQRGGGYWYGYKRVNGRLEKKYIGEQSKVTIAALEAVAKHFADLTAPLSSYPPPAPKPPPIPKAEKKKPVLPPFERTLPSALRIYGLSSVPTKQTLLSRYRNLSKQHHPDTGGTHEDMVAVNLAYDYLKKFV